MSSKRVFVGNLAAGVDETRLAQYFGEVGTVVEVHIPTGAAGRSRGFGFVEFSTEAEAAFAVQVYAGRRFAGRELKVRPVHLRAAPADAAVSPREPLSWSERSHDDTRDEERRGRKPIRDWHRLRGTKRVL